MYVFIQKVLNIIAIKRCNSKTNIKGQKNIEDMKFVEWSLEDKPKTVEFNDGMCTEQHMVF